MTTATPADEAMIVLTRPEYDVLRDVVSAATRLFNQVGPNGSETWAIWNEVLAKITSAHRYERPLAEATTDELLGEVARRMGSPRESETEPSPAPAPQPQVSTSDTARSFADAASAVDTAVATVTRTELPEPTAREITARYHGELQGIQDEKGWAEMEPEALAKKVATLRDLLANGIPADIPITFTPDVLALYGVELDEVEAACRMPTRVEVRPESVDKRYATLAFFRGDLQAIIGFRFPKHPGCMAVYLGSMLEADSHHVEHTGGGGSKTGTRGQNSLPTTPKQLINRLKGSGCSVELDPAHTDGITYAVTFRGENLGLIKSERQPRSQVTNDYNRFLRKMQAIARREEAAAAEMGA